MENEIKSSIINVQESNRLSILNSFKETDIQKAEIKAAAETGKRGKIQAMLSAQSGSSIYSTKCSRLKINSSTIVTPVAIRVRDYK